LGGRVVPPASNPCFCFFACCYELFGPHSDISILSSLNVCFLSRFRRPDVDFFPPFPAVALPTCVSFPSDPPSPLLACEFCAAVPTSILGRLSIDYLRLSCSVMLYTMPCEEDRLFSFFLMGVSLSFLIVVFFLLCAFPQQRHVGQVSFLCLHASLLFFHFFFLMPPPPSPFFRNSPH